MTDEDFVDVRDIFIETKPEIIEVDPETGVNNLRSAKMAQF